MSLDLVRSQLSVIRPRLHLPFIARQQGVLSKAEAVLDLPDIEIDTKISPVHWPVCVYGTWIYQCQGQVATIHLIRRSICVT